MTNCTGHTKTTVINRSYDTRYKWAALCEDCGEWVEAKSQKTVIFHGQEFPKSSIGVPKKHKLPEKCPDCGEGKIKQLSTHPELKNIYACNVCRYEEERP